MLAHPVSDEAPVSRVVAEALVERMDATQVEERATALGLPGELTDVLVKVCACVQDTYGVEHRAEVVTVR